VDDYLYLIFLFPLAIVLILLAWWGVKSLEPKTRRFIRMGSGEQWELDLRLPYRRFKELYPYSTMTYLDYKKLQMKSAYKRAVGSQKNKRMVR
jgi:hypothetical protein